MSQQPFDDDRPSREATGGSGENPAPRVRLDWSGRSFVVARRPGRANDAPNGPTLYVDETIAGAGPPVRLVRGDALDVAEGLAAEGVAGTVDLVYVDPPFASERDWSAEARLDGPADGRVRRAVAYEDKLDVCAYLDMLAPRLDALARLLAPGGSIWVHLDWRAAYLVRVLLDEILGREAFVNEIVWRRAPNLGRQATSQQFGRTLDTIVVYGARGSRAVLTPPTRLEPIDAAAIKWDAEGRPFTTAPRGDYTDESIARLDAEGRVHRSATGRVYIKYFLVKDPHGVWCRERRVDALWTDVAPLRHARPGERTGFPTQKPRALLERIVACSTKPGGTVVDLFAGSGTTGEAAHALGRRAILGDAGGVGIATARARLARAGAAVSVERVEKASPAACDAKLRVDRVDDAHVRVRLEAPREPLAWCVDPAFDGAVFRSAWRSERVPGTKPRPVEHDAIVAAPAGATLGVRVYSDDGAVATKELRA